MRVNGKPALRVGDHGTHSSCCGANTWEAVQGAPGVRINSRAAHRVGDADHHCGGMGKLAVGSGNVNIGNYSAGGSAGAGVAAPPEHIVWFRVVDQLNRSLADVVTHIEQAASGFSVTRRTDSHGQVRVPVHSQGEYHVNIGPEHAYAHAAPAAASPARTNASPSRASTAASPAPAVARVKIGTTLAQPLNAARPTIHLLGWDIEVASPRPGQKLYIEPGKFDEQKDKADHPSAPLMPKVTLQAHVHFTHEGNREEVHDGKLIWDVRIKGKYRVRVGYSYRWQPYDLPGGRFASKPGEAIEVRLAPAEVVGGEIEVYVQYEGDQSSPHAGIKVADVKPCGEILGHNPDRRELFNFIIAQAAYRAGTHKRRGTDYGDLAWLFFRLFAHESSQMQFNGPSKGPSTTAEHPNYGDPAGVGIGQRDPEEGEWSFNPGGPEKNLQFTNEFWPRIFWNWKENVIAGIEAFYSKLSGAQSLLNGKAATARRAHPHDRIPDPPDGVVIREAIRNYNGGSEYQIVHGASGWQWEISPTLGRSAYPESSANRHYPDVVLHMGGAYVPAGGQYPVPSTVPMLSLP